MKDLANIIGAILIAGFAFGFLAFMTVVGTILGPLLVVVFVVVVIYALISEKNDDDEKNDEGF